MSAPIGIFLFKSLPVMRIALIPGMVMRRIPVTGSDNIGGRISVIRGPAILIAEVLIQQSVQKPITLVIGPRRICPNPRGCINVLGRGRIVIASISLTASITLIIRWGIRRAGGASGQQNCQSKN
jgi:hypothetical protein